MKVEAKIQKWGNGLALRVAGVMRDIPHFEAGTAVDVEVSEDGLVIKKQKIFKKNQLPFSEAQLLEGLTPERAHVDILAEPLDIEMDHQ